ncbi:MAG: hypothetical protein ACOH17_10815 [Cellulomonas sp.]
MRSPRAVLATGALLALAACSGAPAFEAPVAPMTVSGLGDTFAGASVGDAAQFYAFGDGDLWPSCWGPDDDIYTAHGDGMGFGNEFADIGTDIISGQPDNLSGATTAVGDEIGQVWTGEKFTRKPTGIACVGGSLYLAVQDLRTDFNEAPAASISRSDDGGKTWAWDASAPMFNDGVFTTIMFLDYGKDYANAPDDYVYAYGLDGNWRDSFDDSAPDPEDLYLARVPRVSVQDRGAWQFSTGTGTWSADIDDRVAVLHDDRRLYPGAAVGGTVGAHDLSVISQGGIVYDKPLDRYLYTSWTELTFEFYESRTPWGPWNLFLSRDFGPYPWSNESHGGYAATLPSKFISPDGRTLWLQSNVCPCAPAGMSVYDFSLRRLDLGK